MSLPMNRYVLLLPTLFLASSPLSLGGQPLPAFDRIVIDADFPGGYQVEVADVNGDGRPDVVGLGGGTCAWYENPSWTKRIVTTPKQTPGIISSATADIDGDGKAEIAIAYEFAMNEPTKGKLLLASQGKNLDDPWSITPIAQVGSIHRLRWGYIMGTPRRVSQFGIVMDKKLELIAAPLFGPSAKPPSFDQEPAHLLLFNTGPEPKSGHWSAVGIGDAPVLHAIDVIDVEGKGHSVVLGANNLGVTRFSVDAMTSGVPLLGQPGVLVPGAPGEAPKKGASEVHVGRLKDGRRFLATVEPWHGTDVAIYLSESLKPLKFGPRTVIDTTLKEGHALWVADVDGDGDDEIFAGHRGAGYRVSAYDFDGTTWSRTILDDAIAAQDLRGGDLDGDGTPDVVAIGGKTHNIAWYKFKVDPRPGK